MQALANDDAAIVDTEIVVTSKLLQGRVEFGDYGGSPSNFRREVMTEESSCDGF